MKEKFPLSAKILLAGCVCILLQWKVLDNMLHLKSFIFIYSIPGLALYMLCYMLFKNRTKIKLDIWSAIGAILISIFFFSFLNYITKQTIPECTKVKIIKLESIHRSNSTAHKIYILDTHTNEEVRFGIPATLWLTLQENDTICMYAQKGMLGYDIIQKFEK